MNTQVYSENNSGKLEQIGSRQRLGQTEKKAAYQGRSGMGWDGMG